MRTLFTAAEIQHQIERLGRQVTRDYADHDLLILGVLKGSIIFLADLTRRVTVPHELGFIQASSYRGKTTEPLELTVQLGAIPDLTGRDVLLLDDIFDTGRTLQALTQEIRSRHPRSLKTAVLLWKPGRSVVEMQPDYFGFQIPDEFVIGFGLDYNDRYRHLPYIAVWEPGD